MLKKFIIAAALFCIAAPLSAYVTNGVKWSSSTVKYYINPDNLYVPPDSAITAIQFAADVWNTQGAAPIKLSYSGQTNISSVTPEGINTVMFRQDAPGSIATTYWWYSGSTLTDADIVLHENYSFSTNSIGCAGNFLIESVVTHEFGHVLGLGHSAVSTATMYPYASACDTTMQSLDPDDIAGLQSIYGSGSTPAPKPKPGKGKGHIKSIVSRWETNKFGDLLIVSDIQVTTYTEDFWITVTGGTLNGLTLVTSDTPVFKKGDQVLISVDASGKLSIHPVK